MTLVTVHLPRHEDTVDLGRVLGRSLFPGAVVGLSGELGAGKTTLVTGIAEGLGLKSGYTVSSPTFTIMQEYPCGQVRLFHLDLYRISGAEDLDSTGYREAVGGPGVLVVEWPENEPDVLPAEHLLVRLEYRDGGRDASLAAMGDRYEPLLTSVSCWAGGMDGPEETRGSGTR